RRRVVVHRERMVLGARARVRLTGIRLARVRFTGIRLARVRLTGIRLARIDAGVRLTRVGGAGVRRATVGRGRSGRGEAEGRALALLARHAGRADAARGAVEEADVAAVVQLDEALALGVAGGRSRAVRVLRAGREAEAADVREADAVGTG